jgi:hypothetical protein
MRRYLICYWEERNDIATDLEELIDAEDIKDALDEFSKTKNHKKISSISVVANHFYTPNLDYINK